MSYRLHASHNALIFQATSLHLTLIDVESFLAEFKDLDEDHSLVVIDLSKSDGIELEALQLLAGLGKSQIDKKIRVMVLAKEALTALIKEKGYSPSLPCYVGIVPIFKDESIQLKSESPTVELLLQAALNALKNSMKVYAQMDLQWGELTHCEQKDVPPMEIAGVGGFFCNEQKGSLVLGFNKESYFKIASSIMKQKYSQFEPQMSDWAGEFVNAMLGRIKTDMKVQGINCTVGIPTVFIGKDLEMFSSSKLTTTLTVIRCTGEFGELFLEMMLTANGENKNIN